MWTTTDARAYPDGVRKFDESPGALLTRIYERPGTRFSA